MIGKLRHQIILQKPNPQTNAYNEDIPGELWTDIAKVWAEILPFKGNEFLVAEQLTATITHKIKIRNMIGISDSILTTYRFFDDIHNVSFNIIQHLTDFYTQDTMINLLCILDEHP